MLALAPGSRPPRAARPRRPAAPPASGRGGWSSASRTAGEELDGYTDRPDDGDGRARRGRARRRRWRPRPPASRRWPPSPSEGGGATIAAVETTVVSARAKPTLAVRGARTTHDASSFVLVRVVTADGIEGYGEISATAAWSGEDAVTATHFVRDVFAPLLRGPAARPDRGAREGARPRRRAATRSRRRASRPRCGTRSARTLGRAGLRAPRRPVPPRGAA